MTTQQVAIKLGISRIDILIIVNRTPHLRPAQTSSIGYLWSDKEIQALQVHLATQKRPSTE